MTKTLILTAADVASLVSEGEAIDVVERAFGLHGRGETRMPSKVYLPLPEFDGDFRAMPVFIANLDVGYGSEPAAGIKWINAHPHNRERFGRPAVVGIFLLSDPVTAHPLAIMDATKLTALRTGAAAAVATRHLARNTARTLGVIGCGAQARSIVRCHVVLRPWERIILADSDRARAAELAEEMTRAGGPSCCTADIEEAATADVVCTLTPSRLPIVMTGWIRPGTHINALGADAPGKRELDTSILTRARIFLDDAEQARESGEVNVPLHQGELPSGAILGTLGEIVAGTLAGRTSDDEITVFDSTGLAVQDLAVARLLYERARRANIGTEISLVAP
jgi:alanine dehydrogenase